MSKELVSIAERIQAGLTQLGHCYQVKKVGLTVGVSFASLELVDAGDGGAPDFGLVEVDMLALPPKVTADKLTKAATLHHLTAVVGKPVYSLNTTGVTYCVDLRSQSARQQRHKLADSVQFEHTGNGALVLGMTGEGPLHVNPEHLQNVLIVGAQGTGKSAFLRLLTYQAVKSGWRLALADPDLATFNPSLWRGANCLVGERVASSPGEVGRLFDLVLAEIERRAELFNQAPGYPDSLTEYNQTTGAALPRIILLVDEANTYFADKDLVGQAADLSRRARKWGLHCIFAGHNWRSADIPRGLSAMLQTRLAFRVSDRTSGRVVLERAGAETLPNVPGRAVIRLGGEYHLIQAVYLDKSRLVELVANLPKSDTCADWSDLDADEPDGTTAAILELAEQGESISAIARQVLGSPAGNNFYKVKSILEEHGKV